jgi:hypothetical protein
MSEDKKIDPVLVEDATIIFRNFQGMARDFNSEGDRNFSVILPKDLALKMKADGWRVKQLKPRGEDEEGDYHIKVKLNYRTGRPPRVVLITSKNRTELGQDEVAIVDAIDIKKVDVLFNGWWSDMQDGGFSAYLKTIFITVNEDELELKYAQENPESNQSPTESDEDAA